MATFLENKKAHFDYEILETFEAGMELYGFEVKSLKDKRGSLAGGFVIVRGGEAFVTGMHIPPYQPANTPEGYDPLRTRKLLLTKKEITALAAAGEKKGLTIVPISVYSKSRKIKLSIGIARGKKKYDKREVIRKKDMARDVRRELKEGGY